MIQRIQLPDYLPDQSNNSGVLLTAENVFKAQDGYRFVGDIEALSDALPATFQGGASAISINGQGYLIAGTNDGLYDLQSAGGTWTTLVNGLSVAGRWKFAQFGNFAIGVNGGVTYEINLSTAATAPLAGAPTATSIAVVGDYVVLGQADGQVNRVRWSAFRDQTGWINGTNQAGELDMLTGGEVQEVVGGEYGIILQRERIVRMERTGDDDAPFQFDEISTNFGCAAANTVGQAGRLIFCLSDRGFIAIEDGLNIRRIGSEKVDRTFRAMVARDNLENIYTAVDPENNLVVWLIPGAPGTAWIYNFELDAWTTAKLNARGIFPGFTTSISLDDFASIGITNLDTLTISLDDPRWSGGNPRLYLVAQDQRVGVLSGPNLAAKIELGNNELIPGLQARVRGVRPFWEGTGGITISLTGRDRLGDVGTTRTTNTLRTSGMMPIRMKGRHVSMIIDIAAGTDWDYIQSLEVEFERGGRR